MIRANPIAKSMVPSQLQAEKSIPNRGEFYPWDWQYKVALSQPEWTLPADQQTDNFYDLNENYKNRETTMFGQPSSSIIYGHRQAPLNPLDQEQTARGVNQIYKVTRIQDVNGVNKISKNLAQNYPVPATFLSYEGRLPIQGKQSLGTIFPNRQPIMFA